MQRKITVRRSYLGLGDREVWLWMSGHRKRQKQKGLVTGGWAGGG